MAAKRLGYLSIFAIAAVCGDLAVSPASGNEDEGGTNARKADLLADFIIFAVKPEGDERDYKLVEIGDTKLDAGLLGVVVKALPLDILGLGLSGRRYDETAEVAQCRAACRANAECRDISYVRPSDDQPVGVCRLKRLVENVPFGVMEPVAGDDERATATPEPPAAKAPRTPPREVMPPPRLPPVAAEYFPPPPRAEPTAPPRMITMPPQDINPPPRIDEAPEPPFQTEAFQPEAPQHGAPPPQNPAIAAPAASIRERKPLPVWLALGAVAFMFGGAGLYWHSHRKRILTRISTRLVSNGLDRHTLSVEGSDHPDIGLRFVVRRSAAVGIPSTCIDLTPAGAFA